jgi:hypothetical protein
MTVLSLLVIVWGILTLVLIALFAWRKFEGLGEEDLIFIDRAEAGREKEQLATVHRLERLERPIKVLAILSGVLLLVIVVWWLYSGLFGRVTI